MKTTIEIMQEVLNCEIGDQDDVRANTFHRTNLEEIQRCMQMYAKEAIRELVTYGDDMKILKSWIIPNTAIVSHGTSTDEDNLQKWMDKL